MYLSGFRLRTSSVSLHVCHLVQYKGHVCSTQPLPRRMWRSRHVTLVITSTSPLISTTSSSPLLSVQFVFTVCDATSVVAVITSSSAALLSVHLVFATGFRATLVVVSTSTALTQLVFATVFSGVVPLPNCLPLLMRFVGTLAGGRTPQQRRGILPARVCRVETMLRPTQKHSNLVDIDVERRGIPRVRLVPPHRRHWAAVQIIHKTHLH
mmetsp:Transcript_58815/g.138531  ORF Transcript_58815/g.138531 Transcript_58815/m.138531 type:complete len:210 (-) Transcript_58815:15-644(-)